MLMRLLRRSTKIPTDPALALLINDTTTDYHWGCFATSGFIKSKLASLGYRVTSFSAATTHRGMGQGPTSVDELAAFYKKLPAVAPELWDALTRCAIVVVNGEGTLHRSHNGPRCLLAFMWAAKRLGKTVHLINHSLFPSGGAEPAEADVRDYYYKCLSSLDAIVAREAHSISNYRNLGIPADLGFDCLPAFANDISIPSSERAIVLCGASNWTADVAKSVAERLAPLLAAQALPIVFLSGGVKCPPEDRMHYEAMRSAISRLVLAEAESVEQWLSIISSSALMITGRFHHLIAAIALSSPIVSMPGNTPKCEAVCDLVGLPSPIDAMSPLLEERVRQALQHPPAPPLETALRARELAERNFSRLPRALVSQAG